MKASIVDLRYKTKDILKALDRNECVTVLYHGKARAIMSPVGKKSNQRVQEHAFFNMADSSTTTVEEVVENLRKPRYDF